MGIELKVSLSTGSLYIYPLRKTFSLAKRAGFDGVELVVGPEVEWRGSQYVKRLTREFDLPVLTVHPPLFAIPGWSKSQITIEPYLDKLSDLARSVGAPVAVIHMPHAKRIDDRIGSGFLGRLASARASLDGMGPKLALENSPKFRERDAGYILRSLPDLRGFAEKYDFPMTLDTSHVGTWNVDLIDSIGYFDGRLANVHFSDLRTVPEWVMKRPLLHSYLRQHQMPGSGFLPLKEFLRELARRGYPGPITYELSPLSLQFWSFHAAADRLKECVEFVHEALK
jgi:sugar phosphate isomerase/epimerase